MPTNESKKIALVYSCSGASSAAQMANHLAVKLDRLQVAEMSCIAGVGGDVKPLVQTAKSGRPIIALDGCPLQCAAKILQRQGLRADKHYELSKLKVKKQMHADFDLQEAARVLQQILADLESRGGKAKKLCAPNQTNNPCTDFMSKPVSYPNSNQYDVAVIGGGPGGAALATFLAQKGRRCLVLEQSTFPRYHIGESLVPHTHGILDRLGFLPKIKASAFPEKHSVRFVSPDGKETTPFYFSWTISGDGARTWQVERSLFDRMMLDHARESGVEVCEGVAVEKVLFDGQRATGVAIANGAGLKSISAKVVVDASGRSTVIGRQLGLKGDVPGLKKASLWGYYRGGKRLPGIDSGETTMLLIPGGGWFWYIPLPDDVVSVGIVADPDYLFTAGDPPEAIFEREVSRCATLGERLVVAQRVGPVRGLRQLAYLNRQTCGDGWVMIGDARAFLDPIYSSGLFLALGSAELAAGCIESALNANDFSAARLGAFEPALWDGVDSVRRLIYAFYDPKFSFREFAERFPDQRRNLIDCLVGDVVKDMSDFKSALAQMTPPPPPLSHSAPLTETSHQSEEL